MAKYLVTATRTTVCQVEVEADTLEEAEEYMDSWIADDFEEYIVDNKWYIDVEEIN